MSSENVRVHAVQPINDAAEGSRGRGKPLPWAHRIVLDAEAMFPGAAGEGTHTTGAAASGGVPFQRIADHPSLRSRPVRPGVGRLAS